MPVIVASSGSRVSTLPARDRASSRKRGRLYAGDDMGVGKLDVGVDVHRHAELRLVELLPLGRLGTFGRCFGPALLRLGVAGVAGVLRLHDPLVQDVSKVSAAVAEQVDLLSVALGDADELGEDLEFVVGGLGTA